MSPRILSQRFYSRDALSVARQLLGKVLVSRVGSTTASGMIVEAEAYLGQDDPASHAFRGSTPRNHVMFGPAGFAYVYFTYGNHFCMNVVTGKNGKASAVLLRALEPLDGVALMRRRRKKRMLVDLTSGPGKLAQALGISKKHYGHDLRHSPLWIEDRNFKMKSNRIVEATRIGIREGKSLPYRFYLADCPYVSKR